LAVVLGLAAFGLGTLGIFVPLLPTAPLYLLAAACLARGSARFHRWFLSTKLYRNHLEAFAASRSMTMRAKLAICVPVTAMLAVAFGLAPNWPIRAVIALVALAKWYYFLARIKTIPASRVAARGGGGGRAVAKVGPPAGGRRRRRARGRRLAWARAGAAPGEAPGARPRDSSAPAFPGSGI
jgi:uncharacterized membrane protein YbaN (DUF454 family)